MGARIADSALYGHLWGTDELRAVFSEETRIRDWIGILVHLAGAQADAGIVPAEAAAAIERWAVAGRLDLDEVARATRETGHSTLGLIRGLQAALPPGAAEWVYYGATVQDLTDTWVATVMRRVGAVVWRDLRTIESLLLGLAIGHRDTPMAGRTHGQPGAPVTFGWKVAGYADEIRRHLDRLREGAPRWLVGQLGGAVGTLAFYGDRGLEVRRRFCARLGLGDPGISWLAARDRVAEFVSVLSLVASILGRLGNEILQLQRAEIGELAEPVTAGSVGKFVTRDETIVTIDSPEALFRALRPSDSGVRHLWAHQADLLRDYHALPANVKGSACGRPVVGRCDPSNGLPACCFAPYGRLGRRRRKERPAPVRSETEWRD